MVGKDDVNVVEAQTLERRLDDLDEVGQGLSDDRKYRAR